MEPAGIRKKIFFIGTILFILMIVMVMAYYLLWPKITISIGGEFDSTVVQVRLDEKVLEPSGSGGNKYSTRVFVGKHVVSVKGQYIEPQSEEISVGIGGKSLEKNAKSVTMESVIKDAFAQNDLVVSSIKTFNDKWLIAYVSNSSQNNKDDSSEYPVLLRFDISTSTWELGSLDNSAWSIEMPREARSYYGSLGED